MRALFFVVAALVAIAIGATYAARLADHRGLKLVAVDDAIQTAAPHPRRMVMVIFDGLGRDDADTMPTIRALEAEWPCLDTDVGPITFSRPSYAQISTGLEMDRTGARNNVDRSPLAAESFWDVAHEAGRAIKVTSDLAWWHELFPKAIPRYDVLEDEPDYFTRDALAEVSLIHPMYVDNAGHHSGAASAEFRENLARANRELSELLPMLDLSRDVLVVTGDHGHTLRGGHGGREPRVAIVRTCFAGAGVAHHGFSTSVSSTMIAPTMAMLDGLRFPRNMRASRDRRDDLDTMFSIVDLPAPYVADRRAAVERFRAANPDWTAFYDKERKKQNVAMAVVVALAALVCARRPRNFLYMAASFAVLAMFHHGFELTAVSGSSIDFTFNSGVACVFATGPIFALRRDVDDFVALVLAGLLLAIAQPVIFGWHMSMPIPGPHVLFFTPVQTMVLLVHALFGLLALSLRKRG